MLSSYYSFFSSEKGYFRFTWQRSALFLPNKRKKYFLSYKKVPIERCGANYANRHAINSKSRINKVHFSQNFIHFCTIQIIEHPLMFLLTKHQLTHHNLMKYRYEGLATQSTRSAQLFSNPDSTAGAPRLY